MTRACDPTRATATLWRARSRSRWTVPRDTPMRVPASVCCNPSPSHSRSASSSGSSRDTTARSCMGMLRGLKTRSPSWRRQWQRLRGRGTGRRSSGSGNGCFVHMHNTPAGSVRQGRRRKRAAPGGAARVGTRGPRREEWISVRRAGADRASTAHPRRRAPARERAVRPRRSRRARQRECRAARHRS